MTKPIPYFLGVGVGAGVVSKYCNTYLLLKLRKYIINLLIVHMQNFSMAIFRAVAGAGVNTIRK